MVRRPCLARSFTCPHQVGRCLCREGGSHPSCLRAHGAAGSTNLLVTKKDAVIVLNPHVANCCVLRLDEQAAPALHEVIGEWLG